MKLEILPSLLVVRSVLGTKKTAVYLALVITLSTLVGFAYGQWRQARLPDATPTLAVGALSEADAAKRTRGLAARDAMAGRLQAALASALERGPVAAIDVCQAQAPGIARQVMDETGVTLGRTSFRLRSPANAPPAWAEPLLAGRPEHEVVARTPQGALGLLLPIRVAPPCVVCHGPRESLAPEVLAALAARYPEDGATGFAPGDLRGWFWVEVP